MLHVIFPLDYPPSDQCNLSFRPIHDLIDFNPHIMYVCMYVHTWKVTCDQVHFDC